MVFERLRSIMGASFLPLVSRICLSLVAATLVASCAAPVDRTKQLLELDLAHRQSAIESLQKKQEAQPEPWRAYSLGVLYGAEADYENMNRWFQRCSSSVNTFDHDIEFIQLGHWHDEALAGDQAAEAGDWMTAAMRFENALMAVPNKPETRLRLVEAKVMAYGPHLEEIRTLAGGDQPQALFRWLEKVKDPDWAQQRMEVQVRLASQLRGATRQNGDALAAYITGELSRLDGDWMTMDQHFRSAKNLDSENATLRKQMKEARASVSGLLLKESLVQWSGDQIPSALAKLDTAEAVDPGRPEIFMARRNITALEQARTPSQVAETLAVGDLDKRWLTFWMSRLYTRNQLREAGMVANELLRYPEALTTNQKSRALRVRVAYSRSIGNLDQTRDDLRTLMAAGDPLPLEAVILGDVLLAQSSYEEARHWFEMAQSWGDDSVSLILKKARIAFSQDRFGEMETLALEATEREPDNEEALEILRHSRTLSLQAEAQK